MNVTKQAVLSGREKNIHIIAKNVPENIQETKLMKDPELLLHVLMQFMSIQLDAFGDVVDALAKVNGETIGLNELRDLLLLTISDMDMEEIWTHIIKNASLISVPSAEPDKPTS